MLPAGMGGRIGDRQQCRWLSRSSLRYSDSPAEMLARVLLAAGLPPVEDGLAALRFWGQTGDRPTVWIAAADPVNLEARLDHLLLHSLSGRVSPKWDLQAVFDFLQQSLGRDRTYAYACIGQHGYLRGTEAFATASVSAALIDGREPDAFMPSGESAAGYHKLLGEVQMCLYEHEVNRRREAEGLMPINSVWFWGGGTAPQKTVQILPPLFGDDPLFVGYWESRTGVVAPWPGNFEECLDFAVGDLVVVTPVADVDCPGTYLKELRALLKDGRIGRLVVLFRDGLTAEVGRFDTFRVWRRRSALL